MNDAPVAIAATLNPSGPLKGSIPVLAGKPGSHGCRVPTVSAADSDGGGDARIPCDRTADACTGGPEPACARSWVPSLRRVRARFQDRRSLRPRAGRGLIAGVGLAADTRVAGLLRQESRSIARPAVRQGLAVLPAGSHRSFVGWVSPRSYGRGFYILGSYIAGATSAYSPTSTREPQDLVAADTGHATITVMARQRFDAVSRGVSMRVSAS